MNETFRIESLIKSHDRTTFSCGVSALDRYFRQQVSQDTKRLVARCFVAIEEGTNLLAGYYTLAASSLSLGDLPPALAKRLPLYPQVPVALLGRLAVSLNFQGRKLGALLVRDAIVRSLQSDLSVAMLITDAKDDQAQAFYEHLGFVPLPEGGRRLILPLAKPA